MVRHINEILDSVVADMNEKAPGKFEGAEVIRQLKDFQINSKASLIVFCELVIRAWTIHKWLTFPKPRVGQQRSIDQNSLFHHWATQYAAHIFKKRKEDVTKEELAGMKRSLKFYCYRDNGWDWLLIKMINPFTGEVKVDYQSSAEYKTGEMYLFLDWVQMKAATDGLVLESKGEFKKNQEKQVA